jgi:hypothetical protein
VFEVLKEESRMDKNGDGVIERSLSPQGGPMQGRGLQQQPEHNLPKTEAPKEAPKESPKSEEPKK